MEEAEPSEMEVNDENCVVLSQHKSTFIYMCHAAGWMDA